MILQATPIYLSHTDYASHLTQQPVYQMQDYLLNHRTRKQFWREEGVHRVIVAIAEKEPINKYKMADILGVPYPTLNRRVKNYLDGLKATRLRFIFGFYLLDFNKNVY